MKTYRVTLNFIVGDTAEVFFMDFETQNNPIHEIEILWNKARERGFWLVTTGETSYVCIPYNKVTTVRLSIYEKRQEG